MQSLGRKKSREIIDQIHDLATLPTIVTKVVSMMDSASTTTGDIEHVIKADQVLTSKLLKLVNSSFYGFSRKIDTVSDAIVLLGFGVVRNLVITSSIFDLGRADNKWMEAVIRDLWTHSIGCGIRGKFLSLKLGILDANEVFAAGILHDIGKVVICQNMEKQFKEITGLIENQNNSILEAEERVLGTTHCEIGKALAEKCNLPDSLIDVIAHHHLPEYASLNPTLVALTHIVDVIDASSRPEPHPLPIADRLDKYSLDRLKLSVESIEDFMEQFEKEMEDVENHFSDFIP